MRKCRRGHEDDVIVGPECHSCVIEDVTSQERERCIKIAEAHMAGCPHDLSVCDCTGIERILRKIRDGSDA